MRLPAALAILGLSACGAGTSPPIHGPAFPEATATRNLSGVYQPLAVGDSWTYVCNHRFEIVNRVLGKVSVRGRALYEFSLQIPSSPTKSIREVQLLGNDSSGNTWIHGYLSGGKVKTIKAAKIVSVNPVLHAHYDYTGPMGRRVTRVFVGFEYTNPTPLGTFWVAPYFESNATHNYGYALGKGIMEEDHGPNYKYDCLIEKIGHAPERRS